MPLKIIVPDSAELGAEITVARWLVQEGEQVLSGQPVAEIEADKGILEIEAPCAGTLLRIAAAAGEPVVPGAVLGFVGEPGERIEEVQASAAAVSPVATPATPHLPGASPSPAQRVPIAPAVRKLAESLGLEVERLAGTGPGGIVTRADVLAAAERAAEAAQAGRGEQGGVP